MSATATQACYRHPDRETGVSCSACGRPICPDCMTSTPVGMRCPECARQKTQVRRVGDVRATAATVTVALIAINVLLFLASGRLSVGNGGGNRVFADLALYGPAVAGGDWWRLITGGFLHAGFIHIAFNMYLLYMLGQMLEPAMGSLRFGLLYFASLLCGSFGALVVSPDTVTVGASGAVFGLMAYAMVELRARGYDPWRSDIGTLVLLNLGLTFLLNGISIGGHIGGLVGGALCGLAVHAAQNARRQALAPVGLAAIAVAAFLGGLAVA